MPICRPYAGKQELVPVTRRVPREERGRRVSPYHVLQRVREAVGAGVVQGLVGHGTAVHHAGMVTAHNLPLDS